MNGNSNTDYSVDVAVIGGGPAGIAGAVTASEYGLKCLIIERAAALGGQIVSVHSETHGVYQDPEVHHVKELSGRLSDLGVTVLTNSVVWHVNTESKVLCINQGATKHRIKFQTLLIATGARERPLLFDGWTLPGVITCGAAQRLATQSRISPGKNVLVAGRGPLMLEAAAELANVGVNVLALIEITPLSQLAARGFLPLVLDLKRGYQAFQYIRTLFGSGVPIFFGHAIRKAEGSGHVEWAITEPIDKHHSPNSSKGRTWFVDAICISNGLEPNLELLQFIGCKVRYDLNAQAFFPQCDVTQQTSVSWIYAAGEVASLCGVAKSIVEGEIAGLNIAIARGAVPEEKIQRRLARLTKEKEKYIQQYHALERAFLPPDIFHRIALPDTIVCRCEEVTLRELRASPKECQWSPRALRLQTRIGFGMCQGRLCLASLYEHVTSNSPAVRSSLEPIRMRPPLEPMRLDDLAGLGDIYQDLEFEESSH